MAVAAPVIVVAVIRRHWYRLDRAPAPVRIPPADGLLLFIVMLCAGMVGAWVARALTGIHPGAEVANMTMSQHATALTGYALGQMCGAGLWWHMTRQVRQGAAMPRRTAAILGLATFAAVWPIVVTVSIIGGAIARSLRHAPVDPIAHETLGQLAGSPVDGWFVLMSVLVVLPVPALEEIAYRGIIQRALLGLDLGRWPAILVTSVVFTAMHWGAAELHALPSLFVLSIGFGWAAERTGGLTAPIVMHVLFNGVNLLLVALMRTA